MPRDTVESQAEEAERLQRPPNLQQLFRRMVREYRAGNVDNAAANQRAFDIAMASAQAPPAPVSRGGLAGLIAAIGMLRAQAGQNQLPAAGQSELDNPSRPCQF